LRVRVPADLRERVGLREVRRTLHTDSLSEARPLALTYAARVLEIFDVTRKRELSKAEVRSLIAIACNDLRREADRGYIPRSNLPELEIEEQREMALARIGALEDGLAIGRVPEAVGVVAAHHLARRGVKLAALGGQPLHEVPLSE
jgi:hypothetical protein